MHTVVRFRSCVSIVLWLVIVTGGATRHDALLGRQEPDGNTRLHIAALGGDASVVSALLEAGADPAAPNVAGDTPLHFAARGGDASASVVSALLEAGADPAAPNDAGDTPLHLAVRILVPSASVISALLEAGADPDGRNTDGETLLHYWARHHLSANVGSALLAAGADVGAEAQDGSTPLHWAAAGRGTQSQSQAASFGAGLTGTAVKGMESGNAVAGVAGAVALGPAVILDGVIGLLRWGSGAKKSGTANVINPAGKIQILVGGGADVESRDSKGNTPLHWAATEDAPVGLVKALLSAGADGATRNAAGRMPVDFVPEGSPLRSLLVSPSEAASDRNRQPEGSPSAASSGRNARIDSIDGGKSAAAPLGSDALYDAIWRDNVEIVRTLVDAGIGVNVVDADGDPFLESAIWRDHREIVKILVAAGADVNAVDADGDPLLKGAIWRDHREIVKILVAAGADVNAVDADGETMLEEAVFRRHIEIVEILLAHGATD